MSPEFPAYLLVVDDSDEDLFLFKRLVHRSGVTLACQSAAGVAPATALLAAAKDSKSGVRLPVACFVDIKMPGDNGFDLLRWIREQRVFDRMPVVMLSSSDHPADLQTAQDLGAQCYLTKYPSTRTLVEVIADAAQYGENAAVFEKPYNLLPDAAARSRTASAAARVRTV